VFKFKVEGERRQTTNTSRRYIFKTTWDKEKVRLPRKNWGKELEKKEQRNRDPKRKNGTFMAGFPRKKDG